MPNPTSAKGMVFPPNFLVGEKYKLIKSIGKGSFGEVFLGQDIMNSTQVAIKIEDCRTTFSQLSFESKVYRYLADGVNVPTAKMYNIDEYRRALIMELLGSSLEELFRRCGRRFSLKTVCLVADQMISLLEYLHTRYIIHRDIKPDNFLIGIGTNSAKVYIVDFGLSKQFYISRAVPHVRYNNKKCMIGTARYASINAHLGIEQSRRDDLESLGYVILYFYLGQLPWQGISGEAKHHKYDRICERKLNILVETLCKHSPSEFNDYVGYCRKLRFDERPDYMYLRQLFRNVLKKNALRYDTIFDWSVAEDYVRASEMVDTTDKKEVKVSQVPANQSHETPKIQVVQMPQVNHVMPPNQSPVPARVVPSAQKMVPVSDMTVKKTMVQVLPTNKPTLNTHRN